MTFSRSLLVTLLVGADLCLAQQYGKNHVPVRRDSPAVEAAFPNPNVTLISPAFASPDTVPAAFSNGTFGPTPDMEMGESDLERYWSLTD